MTQPSKATEMGSYTALAAFMAAYPDVAVFRTFSELNRKNLLYMQAEIAILEDELNDIADEDSKDTHRKDFATNWRSLAKECRENEKKARIAEMQGLPVQLQKTRDGWQWQTFLRIRKLLHEYSRWSTRTSLTCTDTCLIRSSVVAAIATRRIARAAQE